MFRRCSDHLLNQREKNFVLCSIGEIKSLLVCETKKNYLKISNGAILEATRASVAGALKMKGSGTAEAGNYGRL